MIQISMENQDMKNAHDGMQRCWEDLAEAIILQAVSDIRAANHLLKTAPDYVNATRRKKDAICFLRSRWFTLLSDVDGEYILRKLREEMSA